MIAFLSDMFDVKADICNHHTHLCSTYRALHLWGMKWLCNKGKFFVLTKFVIYHKTHTCTKMINYNTFYLRDSIDFFLPALFEEIYENHF